MYIWYIHFFVYMIYTTKCIYRLLYIHLYIQYIYTVYEILKLCVYMYIYSVYEILDFLYIYMYISYIQYTTNWPQYWPRKRPSIFKQNLWKSNLIVSIGRGLHIARPPDTYLVTWWVVLFENFIYLSFFFFPWFIRVINILTENLRYLFFNKIRWKIVF